MTATGRAPWLRLARLGVALAALAGGPAALAVEGCVRPEAPRVPDGATATEDELAAAGNAVRAFIDQSQTYLACLEEKEASYGDDITASQQALINAIYNAGVAAMQAAADDYNSAVRLHRAREDG